MGTFKETTDKLQEKLDFLKLLKQRLAEKNSVVAEAFNYKPSAKAKIFLNANGLDWDETDKKIIHI